MNGWERALTTSLFNSTSSPFTFIHWYTYFNIHLCQVGLSRLVINYEVLVISAIKVTHLILFSLIFNVFYRIAQTLIFSLAFHLSHPVFNLEWSYAFKKFSCLYNQRTEMILMFILGITGESNSKFNYIRFYKGGIQIGCSRQVTASRRWLLAQDCL